VPIRLRLLVRRVRKSQTGLTLHDQSQPTSVSFAPLVDDPSGFSFALRAVGAARIPAEEEDSRAERRDHTMSSLRLTYTERRRARMARKFDRLDLLENRTTITEPISLTALSLGGWMAWMQAAAMPARGAGTASPIAVAQEATGKVRVPPITGTPALAISIVPSTTGGQTAGRSTTSGDLAAECVSPKASHAATGDWLTLMPRDTNRDSLPGLNSSPKPSQPASPGIGGGSSVSPITPAPPFHGRISPLRFAPSPS